MTKKKIKTFVLDTNVLLSDPEAIFRLDDNDVVIPDVILEEIDRFKSEQTERGQNSRRTSRILDKIRSQGNIVEGLSLGNNKGKLFIAFTSSSNNVPFEYDLTIYDNRILYLCKKLKQMGKNVTLITKDINLRVKASTVSIHAEDYKNDKIIYKETERSYTGRTIAFADKKLLSNLYPKGFIPMDELFAATGEKFKEQVYVNEFFELYPIGETKPSCVCGRFDGKKIVPLAYRDVPMKNIVPRNIGQYFMKEALMQAASVAPLVILKGMAGTAKTFFALAAGLSKYAAKKNKSEYNRILICRPSVTMDEEIGHLPGTEKEKISPYMRAIKDNVFAINNGTGIMTAQGYKQAEDEVELLFEEDFIKTEALAFQRGRSLNYHWFILDEMQNSTIRQAKTIITRGGIGTKVIFLGDPDQIDSPYLDSQTNGITYASEKMKGSPLCWQVTLREDECERSALAMEAATRM